MNRMTLTVMGSLAVVIVANTGCPMMQQCELSDIPDIFCEPKDEDRNCFDELGDAQGLVGDEKLALMVINEISRGQAIQFAEREVGTKIPDALLGGIGTGLFLRIKRNNDIIGQGFIELLDVAINDSAIRIPREIACPTETETVEVEVKVSVTGIPFIEELFGLEEIVLIDRMFRLMRDEGGDLSFTCGQLITITTLFDDATGEDPFAMVTIEDQTASAECRTDPEQEGDGTSQDDETESSKRR